MHWYLATISGHLDCPTPIVDGAEDHVHLLVELPRVLTVADLVQELKRASSRWAKRYEKDFQWQHGYGVFPVSESQRGRAIAYIAAQEEHHRKVTFQEEYRRFLAQHRIEFDERYVWD